jgi:hypothetical protein
VSGETPIYDATCRAVGPPPAAGPTSAEATADAGHPSMEGGGARSDTVARSRPVAQPDDPRLPSPDDDPRTADLSIPEGGASRTHAENP